MKILLINPPRVDGYPVVREERFEHKDVGSIYPPLSLLMTASYLEENGYQVKLIDANGFNLSLLDLKKEITSFKPDVVLIRAGFDTFEKDIEVLKLAKNRGVTIVRNHILSRTPKLKTAYLNKYKFIDIFLNQEPESVLLPLLKSLTKKTDLKNVRGISFRNKDKIINNQDTRLIKDLDKLPYPAYHLLPSLKVYYSGTFGPPFIMVQGSRGCPYNCAFCAYNQQQYRFRSAKSIADEIEWLAREYSIHDFCFWDDIVTLDEKRMIKICKAIMAKKLSLRWSVGIRADTVNKRMLSFMKQAGCDEIAVGVESGSNKILENINKRETLEDIKNAADLCHKLKIKFYAMFIIGLPGETKETVMQTIKFAKSLKPFYSQFCFATPFPNTRIYKYYKKNKLLLTKNWSKYFPLNKEPVIQTKALSKYDLIVLRNLAYKKTLFNPLYLIKHIKLTDWRWNIKGFIELFKRMTASLKTKPVR
ncbi:B12-binding domain-containing radical SAM protein [Patescibacteria group bacterium]